ncbi:MAG: GNAT family N-acetyltransferase [Candidatus Paceibacterota bacterium]|jgi:RimJ/RimL family protein N-acetyltransferase
MRLKGEKVILRPLALSDAPRFVTWFNDPAVHRFLARRELTLQEERKWIRSLPKKKDGVHFAIDTREGVHIGSVGFNDINRKDNYAVFGIAIGDKRYWGKGYGTDAMKCIIDYGFRTLRLHRIELEVYEYNVRGIKLYCRLGFKIEGEKRERVYWKGKYYNTFQMAILRNEWQKAE